MGKKTIKVINNCSYSEPSVHPKGWKGDAKKLLKEDWYISYRFYNDGTGEKKQVIIRCNQHADLKQRQDYVIETLAGIKQALEVNGWNPISKKSISKFGGDDATDINPHTPFIAALNYAYKNIGKADTTMRDIKGVIANVKDATEALGLTYLNIGSVTRKHLRQIFDKCAILKDGTFSADKFNRHRTYLGILYNELIEFEAVEANTPLAIKPKKEDAKQKKEVLTKAERAKLIAHLEKTSPRFLLFIQAFYHSGSRIVEFLSVRVKDLDFESQSITYHVKKGRKYQYKVRPMKDIALPYWQQAIEGAKQSDYVWSKGLLCGATPGTYNTVKMRWQRLQKKLGFKVGFYPFKHLNTTETRKLIGVSGAAVQNAESEDMINRHYDVDKAKDEMQIIKSVNNPL